MFNWGPKRSGRKSKSGGHKTKKEHQRAKASQKNRPAEPIDMVPPKMLIEDSGSSQQPLYASPELDIYQLIAGRYIIKLDDHTGRRLDEIELRITTLDDRVSKLEGPASQPGEDPARNLDPPTPTLKAIGDLVHGPNNDERLLLDEDHAIVDQLLQPEQHSSLAAQINTRLSATETHLPPTLSEEAQHHPGLVDSIPSYCPRCLTNHTNHLGSGAQGYAMPVLPSPIMGHQQHQQVGRGGREEPSFIPQHRPPEAVDNRSLAFLFVFVCSLFLLAAKF